MLAAPTDKGASNGMHPALPAILATLSGAGFGLLAWIGLSLFMLHTRADLMPALLPLYLWSLLAGVALVAIGLVGALAHLRPWRGPARRLGVRWAREGALALATLLPALTAFSLLLLAEPGPGRAIWIGACGLLLAMLALATVACTAAASAPQPPVPAWRDRLMVPVHLLFALLTGLSLLFWLMATRLPFAPMERSALPTLAALGAVLVVCKAAYWYRIDRLQPAASGGAAVPEAAAPGHAHDEAGSAERERSLVLARQHAPALRLAAAGLLLGVPLLAWGLGAAGLLSTTALLAATCLALLAGALVERWLYFAQARHAVPLQD